MAKIETKEITINQSKGAFSIFRRTSKTSKRDYKFEELSELRQLLSNEKARLLDVIKTQHPSSIYELSKKLGRGFKSVRDDVKLLEKFKIIELIPEKTKKRTRHKPVVSIESLIIKINV